MRGREITLEFKIGAGEIHDVAFYFDRSLGRLKIAVDGSELVNEIRTFSLSLTKRYSFSVGEAEVHEVVIEKRRKLAFAGLRPQTVEAFVDGDLVASTKG